MRSPARVLAVAVAVLAVGVPVASAAPPWTAPTPILSGASDLSPLSRSVAVGPAGDVVAAGRSASGVLVAVRPAGGPTVAQQTLGTAAPFEVATAVDAAGDAVVAWSAGDHLLRFSYRPHGGSFGAPVTVTVAQNVEQVRAGIDDAGEILLAWSEFVGSSRRLGWAVTDTAGTVQTSGFGPTQVNAFDLATNRAGDMAVAWAGQDAARTFGTVRRTRGRPFQAYQTRSDMPGIEEGVAIAPDGTVVAGTSATVAGQRRLLLMTAAPGAPFADPVPATPVGEVPLYLTLAMSGTNEVVAGWATGFATSALIGAPGGPFGAVTPLTGSAMPSVAMAPSGFAAAIAQADDGKIQARLRAPGQAWGGPEDVGTSVGAAYLNVASSQVQVDEDGDAVASYESSDGVLALAFRDNAGPQLRDLVVPATVTAGDPATLTVAPVDVAGSVASTHWDFGDGTPGADGTRADHAFATPGSYAVQVTAVDDAGRATTATRTVTVVAPPAPAASPAPEPVVDAGTPTPVPTPPPATPARLTAASAIKLSDPPKSCTSRRTITLRFAAPKSTKIVKAKIKLAGKTTTYTGKKLTPKIDLKGLPKGTFSVSVTITLADGRTTTLTKKYKTCVKARKKTS